MAGQLRVLTLNEGENLEATLFRLEKGWTLHFVLGPSLADKNVRIFVNHPSDGKAGPNRDLFREVAWQNLSASKSDVYDNFAEVNMVMSGSFNYYFTTDGSDNRKHPNGSGYFLVDPVLKAGIYDEKIPLDCITCQTVLSKLLGPFDEWEARLRVAKETGYNMIHFTPIQELGYSNSAYALADQHKLNPVFSPGAKKYSFDDVDALVTRMRKEWEVLSLTDLVYNHTANNSDWIQEHPECVYNVVNSPHLKPAYLLDRILWHFTLEVAQDSWSAKGLRDVIKTEYDLNYIREILSTMVLPQHRIHEYFQVHVDDVVQQFRRAIMSGVQAEPREGHELLIVLDPKYRRLKATVDMHLAQKLFNIDRRLARNEEDRVNQCCDALRQRLYYLNQEKFLETESHLKAAVDNFVANARWRFVDPNGPRVAKVSEEEPIMWNYFLLPKQKLTVEKEEELMHTTEFGSFCMAHNGWVMNDDPMRNFAEPGSNVYLRRELLPWGDSVKLRYGKKPEDCPYLWQHMAEYTRNTARIFHGVRLDNCHSTPIHVAEHMLDEARKVRPDLYVIAELFTSSEYKDNIFINRLGLTSLIRESLNAWDSHEQGRLVHRYGGYPVGAFIQPPARPLVPCMAHAIFLDQTHDNPSAVEKRSAYDLIPTGAMVAMAACATGSNRGYDEMVPHHINVVTEKRLYQSWTEADPPGKGQVNGKTGIIACKKALNVLHQEMGMAGFNQVYVDQVDKEIVSITRHNPVSHQSIILVSRTAFSRPHRLETGHVPPLCVPGVIDEIILEARLVPKTGHSHKDAFTEDTKCLNGLADYFVHMQEHVKVYDSDVVELHDSGDCDVQEVRFVNFPPGSIIAFRVSLISKCKGAILAIRSCLSQFGYRMRTYSGRNLEEIIGTDFDAIVTRLSLNDLNRVLYRCDPEERDDGKGIGVYDIPGYGPMPYCGLQGVMSVLSKIRAGNDLGHPLCDNLRNGDWLPQYVASRLLKHPGTREVGKWLEDVFGHLSQVPRYLIPCYFDAILTGVFMVVEEVAWAKMSDFVRTGSSFLRALAMGSIQFCSEVKTAHLPALSPSLAPPHPPTILNEQTSKREEGCVTIAAGLPHFSSGIFRSWGRDTFIALRGVLLLTGRFEEARYIILAYASTLRHGLIPNLLGEGRHARFNCRDAVWWWLQCIQDYCTLVPHGTKILQDKVSRIFPTDDSEPQPAGTVDQPLRDVMQEALQRHATGVKYRERNAGTSIDQDMTDEGFNSEIGVDWTTGFVFGGNDHNCGTWMDKMGSSTKTNNKGKPATPRDGSAVEIVGLSKSAVRWLADISDKKLYPFSGVDATINGKKVEVTFKEWDQKICDNFEKFFWISKTPVPANEPKPELINRRGIYKDSYDATQFWADYQLRPNFAVAMVMAPELFTPENAWESLALTEELLLGPLGMKTLDPSDWAYNGNYDNNDDSKGFNYHQGPEWVWPLGYFLRAKLHFAKVLDKKVEGCLQQTINFIKSALSHHNVYIRASTWRSLPELTNKDGAHCRDSCAAQAWSMSSILEVLYDLEHLNNH